MKQIKEYGFGISESNKMYFIDTNILFAISQFYYRGKCITSDDDKNFTDNFVKFILNARREAIQDQYSIIEICYDYNTNKLNEEQMSKVSLAYDYLIMEMSDAEILNHKGTSMPEARYNTKRKPSFTSIYECNLPSFMFGEFDEVLAMFYRIYLIILKIYNLYFMEIPEIQKIEKLFDFMTIELGSFFGYEFNLAMYLFLGQKNEIDIAQRILKPNKNPRIDQVINPIIDIFQYRMMRFIAELSVREKFPINPIFVTTDIGLQKYIENNVNYETLITKGKITSINCVEASIKKGCKLEWDNFYYNKFYPYMKSIYMRTDKINISDSDVVRRNILQCEKELFKL